MKPLRKGFEATEKTVSVKIEGEYYDVANLKKSGIVNQSTVLLAYGEKWHEINVLNLGADNSNLENFKSHVELHDYKLKDFGIQKPEQSNKAPKKLNHDDHMRLQEKFPAFSYIKIAKLYDYCSKKSPHYGENVLCEDLKRLTERSHTVEQHIDWLQSQKKEIINNPKPKFLNMKSTEEIQQRTDQREFQLFKLGLISAGNTADWIGHGFSITRTSVESDTEEDWVALIQRITAAKSGQTQTDAATATENPIAEAQIDALETKQYIDDRISELTEMGFETVDGSEYIHPITNAKVPFSSITDLDFTQWFDFVKFINSQSEPAAAVEQPAESTKEQTQTPAKKPISLEIIGSLTPDRIADLQNIATETEELLKAHVVTPVTDKASRDKLDKSRAAMLKACTALDGASGITANKNKFLKKFSQTLDAFINPLTAKRRKRYEEIKTAIDTFDNAEALRIQEEQTKKLIKINDRTKQLFDVPMVFNGELYTIGNLHILPSQIETLSDEDFDALVLQAQGIKSAIDTEANKPDPMVLAAAQMLANATNITLEQALEQMKNAATAKPAVEESAKAAPAQNASASQPHMPAATSKPSAAQTPAAIVWEPDTVFTNADPSNTILVALDAENAHAITHPGYLKCRSYYKRGTKDMAAKIRDIFASDHPKKSDAIKELLEIIEKS